MVSGFLGDLRGGPLRVTHGGQNRPHGACGLLWVGWAAIRGGLVDFLNLAPAAEPSVEPRSRRGCGVKIFVADEACSAGPVLKHELASMIGLQLRPVANADHGRVGKLLADEL